MLLLFTNVLFSNPDSIIPESRVATLITHILFFSQKIPASQDSCHRSSNAQSNTFLITGMTLQNNFHGFPNTLDFSEHGATAGGGGATTSLLFATRRFRKDKCFEDRNYNDFPAPSPFSPAPNFSVGGAVLVYAMLFIF